MLLIECPWCGPRAESEFTCGGETDIARPLEPEKLSDREWGSTSSCDRTRAVCIASNGCMRKDAVAGSRPHAMR